MNNSEKNKKMKKILITGTAGFIGFHLVDRLLNEDVEIYGIDSINDYYDTKLKFGRLEEHGISESDLSYGKTVQSSKYPFYHFTQLNLEDNDAMDALFEEHNFDYVVNLAAQPGVRYSLENPRAYIKSNIDGFMNLLECCRNHKPEHLVFASSSSVYGLNGKIPFTTSDNVDHPISMYAATKKSNELMAHTYSHLFGIPSTGLRFFTVYGPWGRPDMALFIFTKNILERKPIKVFNHGNMSRDFTYVGDIVESIKRIIKIPPDGNKHWNGNSPDPASSRAPYKIFNIGNNNPIKLLDMIEEIEIQLGVNAEKKLMDIQPGDVERTFADVNDLIATTGYKPATPLKKGIKAFIDWYKNFYGVK